MNDINNTRIKSRGLFISNKFRISGSDDKSNKKKKTIITVVY
jgi:hypothetical protein